jgi:hypothetical protein
MKDHAEEFIAWLRPRLCAPCHWLLEQTQMTQLRSYLSLLLGALCCTTQGNIKSIS